MADHGGRAAKERLRRSFAAIALMPSMLVAQQSCPTRLAWEAGPSLAGTASAAVSSKRSLVMIGEPFFTMRADSLGVPVALDTNFAGLRRSASGALELIPRPPGVRAFLFPRAGRVDTGAIEVIWTEPDFDTGASYGHGAWFLRAATLRGTSWSEPRTLGRYFDRMALTRQMGSDMVRAAGAWRMAFTVEDSSTGARPLVLATLDSLGWKVREDRLLPRLVGSVAISDDRGELVALVAAVVPPPIDRPGVTTRLAIWATRLGAGGWTALEPVGGDGVEPRNDPQLVATSTGVIAAWIRPGDTTSTLEWRDISRDHEFGPIQHLDGVLQIVSGLDGHRDLLSVSMSDGTSRVLRLRADGVDELGRYPSSTGFAFPVAGTRERPITIVTDIAERGGHQWPTLVAYDLVCARPPSKGAPPRR